MFNFYHAIRWTDIKRYPKADRINTNPALRLYKSSPERATLQIRGPEQLHNAKNGKHGVIACASVDRADLEALRSAIDKVLELLPCTN